MIDTVSLVEQMGFEPAFERGTLAGMFRFRPCHPCNVWI